MDQLYGLLHPSGGRRETSRTAEQVRRRITRVQPPGYAFRVGSLFADIISSVNDVARLDASPLTLVDVLGRMEDGKAVLASMQNASDVRTLAQVAIDSAAVVGPACKSGVTGMLASPNKRGQLSTREVSNITGATIQYVRQCKKRVSDGDLGTYGLARRDGRGRDRVRIRKSTISEPELVCVILRLYVVLRLHNEFVCDSPLHVTQSHE